MLPVLPSVSAHHVHLENNGHSASQRNQNSTTTTKRNSSIIFRIEHLLPAQTTSDHTQSQDATSTTTPHPPNTQSPMNLEIAKSSIQPTLPGIYAGQFIPKDTASNAVLTAELISGLSTANEVATQQQHQRAGRTHCVLKNSRLSLTAHLMRRVKLSEDINSYNVLFELEADSVRMRTVRDISSDEELVAWFTEEVSVLMSMPFLTPLNIQGNKRYTCHVCQLTFESPNPLKIHLALACGRHPVDILWLRLHYAARATHLNQHILTTLASATPLTPTITLAARLPMRTLPSTISADTSFSTTCPRSSTNTLLTHPYHHHHHHHHHQHRQHQHNSQQHVSAFKPISPSSAAVRHTATTTSSNNNRSDVITTSALRLPLLSHHTQTVASPALSFLPSMSTSAAVATALNPMGLLQSPNPASSLNAAAQIEAIVSNMGASKQGHLCIYCGKVYSRKYGLKIHIRTHTGFKPLKCKFCLRPFGDPSNLNKHVRLHLQSGVSATATTNASAAVTSSGDDVTVEGYECRLCHKTLARRRDLQRHMETKHSQGIS